MLSSSPRNWLFSSKFVPDFAFPSIKMIFSSGQAAFLVVLTLNIPRIAGFNITDIEDGVDSDFGKLENDVEDAVKSALHGSDGVLAQFTMGHQSYAMRHTSLLP